MPLCNRRQCRLRGIEQDDNQFRDEKGRLTKACLSCRKLGRARWEHSYYRQRHSDGRFSRGTNGADSLHAVMKIKEILEVGDPPRFNFEWERRMHEGWLVEMKKLVVLNSLKKEKNLREGWGQNS